MVEIFIDEGGRFTRTDEWSLVCALVLPSFELSKARRKITYLMQDWPKTTFGEVKGGLLQPRHLEKLVEQLFMRGGLFYVAAIDMAREDHQRLVDHKKQQAELTTKFLTPQHRARLTEEIWELRRKLEAMPVQLYVQSALMTELTATVIERTAMYFAQRRPQEIGTFNWTVDAKDPRRITAQEEWWRDTLGPIHESRSRRQPLGVIADPKFDYSYFDRSFLVERPTSYPSALKEPVLGYDVKRVLTNRIPFLDSRSDILLQAVDVLTSFFRRTLMGELKDVSVARDLGRMQIRANRNGVNQSMQLLSLTGNAGAEFSKTSEVIRAISLAGRSLVRTQRNTRT